MAIDRPGLRLGRGRFFSLCLVITSGTLVGTGGTVVAGIARDAGKQARPAEARKGENRRADSVATSEEIDAMSTSDKTIAQVKDILRKLDRSIEDARDRRLRTNGPAARPGDGAREVDGSFRADQRSV